MNREEIREIFAMPFILIIILFILLGRCIEWLGYPFWLIAAYFAGGNATSVNDYRDVMRELPL